MGYKLLWSLSKANPKTGVIPTAWPADYDAARESCKGCALLDSHECYAWYGSVPRGLLSVIKGAAADSDRYTLESCLQRAFRLRNTVVKAARLGPIGDPSGADGWELRNSVRRLRKEGLSVLAYTHFWRRKRVERIRDFCRASCNNVGEAELAQSMGWAVSAILPWDHSAPTFWVGGTRGLVCPVQRGVDTTCNDCRACDITRYPRPIGFIDHSHKARNRKARALKMAGE